MERVLETPTGWRFRVKYNFILNLETRRDAFPGDRPEGAGPRNAFSKLKSVFINTFKKCS